MRGLSHAAHRPWGQSAGEGAYGKAHGDCEWRPMRRGIFVIVDDDVVSCSQKQCRIAMTVTLRRVEMIFPLSFHLFFMFSSRRPSGSGLEDRHTGADGPERMDGLRLYQGRSILLNLVEV
jgi:hypothetical protein